MKTKSSKKKRYRRKKSEAASFNHEIIGIIVLAVGVLSFFSMYFKQMIGIAGDIISGFLLGMMGIPAFVIPPIIIIYSIFLIFKKDSPKFKFRMTCVLVLLVLVSSLIQAGVYNNIDYINRSLWTCMSRFYEDGKILKGGGVIGGLISFPFLMFFQVVGTIIILTTISIIDIIILTNMSIANFIRNIRSVFASPYESAVINIKTRKAKKEEPTFETDIEEEPKKEPKKKIKIFDLNTEKEARKAKKDIEELPKEPEQIEKINIINEELKVEEPHNINLIMEDVKRQKASEKQKIQPEPISIESMNSAVGSSYTFPPIDMLESFNDDGINLKQIKNSAIEGAKKLEDTLKSFGVEAKVINVSRGPAVTRYELQPSPGVKVSKIVNLADDISLNLAAAGIRIEAPIPGKAAIGIEIANKEVTPVMLREVIETRDFVENPSKLAFSVGKDISGKSVVGDIGKMPHLLVAGATGSGKSVCINSIIISLLYKATPDQVKLLMIDPKVVELGIYNGIPHLLIPVVTDPRKAAGALNWAVQEMVNRYKLFAEKGVRDLKGYNSMAKKSEEATLPEVVIIIDELADLMMVAPNDVEDAICRLAQMARAAGMHLVIATQRPSVDVITGVIKANIPSRIAFSVASQVDSRTILDMAGAEKLLGKGDMLFYPIGEPKPIRIKGTFVSDKEVESIVEFIKSRETAEYNNDIIEEINSEKEDEESDAGDNDELLPQAIALVVEAGQASVSLIQRKFKVGYARAARIVDQMEARGIVGGYEGSKPRQVLVTRQQWNEMQMHNGM